MNSIQLTITADEQQQDILIAELSALGAEGFEQKNDSLIAYFNELGFNSYDVNMLLKGHVFTVSTVGERNWNEVWESNFEPVVVEGFCGIRAGFHPPIAGVAHEIVITPKMSFGTGHHATTYMMMAQMEHMELEGKTVFDFGTGTGILAILAEKLGAGRVIAIDNDAWSIENARENIAANGCSRIDVSQSEVLPNGVFDSILANINRNVILDYLPQLKEHLIDKGCLLMSGLLVTDEAAIAEACASAGFQLLKRSERNQWVSLLFVNSK